MEEHEIEALFHSLFDWWRGDNGLMLDGEEMPDEQEQQQAIALLGKLEPYQVAGACFKMTANRWFRGSGGTQVEFIEWLDERLPESCASGTSEQRWQREHEETQK